jgi:hypothetical protein
MMVEGEVNFLRVAVGIDAVKRVMGPFDYDVIVQVSHGTTNGVYLALKRGHFSKDMKVEVFNEPKRFPLGKRQVLWVGNENKAVVNVSFEHWKAGRPV